MNRTKNRVPSAAPALRPNGRPSPALKGAWRLLASDIDILNLESADLEALSRERGWSLSLTELEAVRGHFRRLGRAPTDVEIETIAQTWSEHCKHKTFTSPIEYVEAGRRPEPKAKGRRGRSPAPRGKRRFVRSLLHETIVEATRRLDKPYCLSVFKDNAGIVAFDGKWALAFKVETHNHPCAVEPYGGSETGAGGVIRDVLGAGLGAKPILNTDVFCVGLPGDPGGRGRLPPRRTLREMVAGVRDYGNRMGIPTASGAVYFDEGYRGNPLCFCGTLGILPRSMVDKEVRAGDLVVAIGGRTGRDGLHGATLSSGSLESFESSAVQIGHAILEKKMLDALLKCRDQGLYRAVTDCGAGGFSSAVGEMAEGVGAEVRLEKAPLKHGRLRPWEIWLSESQERMVLAVPPTKLERLEAVLEAEGVEHAVLGRFTGDGKLRVLHGGRLTAELDLDFLHRGLPKRTRRAEFRLVKTMGRRPRGGPKAGEALRRLLAHPNIASREWIIRQYDHEVQGQTAVKPLQGRSGPGDACVVWPRSAAPDAEPYRGVAVANGLASRLGRIDPRLMAFAAVDEALRNLAAVGADVTQAAILDNFCWGDVEDPKELGRLVRCAFGCRDAALAYGAPFISGKDSLHNTTLEDGRKVGIPGTLLVSSLAPMPDVRRAVTMDFKDENHPIYLVGATYPELGGSHYEALRPGRGFGRPPRLQAGAAALLAAMAEAARSGAVLACHDLSEGGLAVGLAEMAIAGGVGARVDLDNVRWNGDKLDPVETLFAESLTRWVVELDPEREREFQKLLSGFPIRRIGMTGGHRVVAIASFRGVIDEPVADLERVFKEALPKALGEAA